MFTLKQTETFRKWRTRLRDERARTDRLPPAQARLRPCRRCKASGQGVSELRVDYGPGYRIYFQRKHDAVIVLLCGGDKSTQAKDIKTAQRLARETE